MTLAVIMVVLTIAVVIAICIACWRKAKVTGVAQNPWTEEDDTTDCAEIPSVPSEPMPAESTGTVTTIEDTPKEVEAPTITVAASVGKPIENPWENCKTVECEAKPIAELESQSEPKVKKERKPRKTPLERTEDAIAKIDGQIGRRTTLLKQLKKPVTKDERLIKWKSQLKDLKAVRKELLKAAKTK